MTISDQVSPDNVRHGGVIVDHHDAARRVGVICRGHHRRYGLRSVTVVSITVDGFIGPQPPSAAITSPVRKFPDDHLNEFAGGFGSFARS
jgi:hypothetical protein